MNRKEGGKKRSFESNIQPLILVKIISKPNDLLII